MKAICRKCTNQCTVTMEIKADLPENCLYKGGSVEQKWEDLKPEPELMTLQEAFEKAGSDDVLRCRGFGSAERRNITILGNFPFKIVIEKCWQIIPAELKLVDAQEFIYNTFDDMKNLDKDDDPEFTYPEMVAAFDGGEENQWLNHKELREAVEKWIHVGSNSQTVSKIVEVYKNLKPLKQND